MDRSATKPTITLCNRCERQAVTQPDDSYGLQGLIGKSPAPYLITTVDFTSDVFTERSHVQLLVGAYTTKLAVLV